MKKLSRRCLFAFFKNLVIFLALVLALPPTEVRAASINFLTVDEAGVADGFIGYAGGENPMVSGVGRVPAIDIDVIFGTNTPLKSGTANAVACVECSLSFVTGARLSVPGRVFDGGGEIVIFGTVPAAGIVVRRLLLAGQFEGAFMVELDPVANEFGAFAAFLDLKSADLAAYFGLPGGAGVVWSGSFGMGLSGPENPENGAFLMEAVGGVNNLAGIVINRIPAPGTLTLVALALLGMGLSRIKAHRRISTATTLG